MHCQTGERPRMKARLPDRLYQLVRQSGTIADRTVSIRFERPGIRAYVFTFG